MWTLARKVQGERIWENGWCRGGEYGRHSTRRVGQERPAYAVRGADLAMLVVKR